MSTVTCRVVEMVRCMTVGETTTSVAMSGLLGYPDTNKTISAALFSLKREEC